ncbi:MAG: DNA alkylation repair protein [Planctomycetes bacterium]|nr:DNA alkylation repair protein [Planctomycetota bacterium]
MNFSREQMLLRQRLQAAGSPAVAQQLQQEIGGDMTFLGAGDDAIRAAASDLAAAYPQMGRAQMTAFVRTLWQSRIHELRAVGVELLAARAELLEPHDLAFLETLLKEGEADALASKLAADVLGTLVVKNKKLWRDLRRFANASNEALQRAAVRACRLPLLHDDTAFERFEELTTPLFAVADARLQQAIDELLAAAAAVHLDAVQALAQKHGRTVKVKARPRSKAAAAKPAAPKPAKAAPPAKKTTKKAAAKAPKQA